MFVKIYLIYYSYIYTFMVWSLTVITLMNVLLPFSHNFGTHWVGG